MGQAKQRGNFDQRKAESIAKREAEYKARPASPIRRRSSSGLEALIAAALTGTRGFHGR